jgi:cell wall-associated NlpC family hydrolase
MNLILRPGDVILVRGRSRMARLIRWFTRAKGEAPTRVTHVALAVSNHRIVEATRHGAQERTYDRGQVYRPRNVSLEAADRIVKRAQRYVGAPYGWGKIVLHAIGMERFAFVDGAPICSWLVAVPYSEEGYTFGVPANAATPNDIATFILAHPDKYNRVDF